MGSANVPTNVTYAEFSRVLAAAHTAPTTGDQLKNLHISRCMSNQESQRNSLLTNHDDKLLKRLHLTHMDDNTAFFLRGQRADTLFSALDVVCSVRPFPALCVAVNFVTQLWCDTQEAACASRPLQTGSAKYLFLEIFHHPARTPQPSLCILKQTNENISALKNGSFYLLWFFLVLKSLRMNHLVMERNTHIDDAKYCNGIK